MFYFIHTTQLHEDLIVKAQQIFEILYFVTNTVVGILGQKPSDKTNARN